MLANSTWDQTLQFGFKSIFIGKGAEFILNLHILSRQLYRVSLSCNEIDLFRMLLITVLIPTSYKHDFFE